MTDETIVISKAMLEAWMERWKGDIVYDDEWGSLYMEAEKSRTDSGDSAASRSAQGEADQNAALSRRSERELWTIIRPDGEPVPPYDCNPGCDDQGMLVYQSREAAENSASRQARLHDVECVAIPLDRFGIKIASVKATEAQDELAEPPAR